MAVFIEEIKRSRRKTVSLALNRDGKLTVHAPLHLSAARIQQIADSKENWIRQKRGELKRQKENLTAYGFHEGGSLLLFGKTLRLIVEPGLSRPALREGILAVPEKFREDFPEAVRKWYISRARSHFAQRAAVLSETYGFRYASVRITGARTRWGSCGPAGTLNFTFRLMAAPPRVIDSVIVHELCHTVHHNHSAAFWQTVKSVMPDYDSCAQWLHAHAFLMDIG